MLHVAYATCAYATCAYAAHMLHVVVHRSGCALNGVRSCLFPRLPRDRPLAAAQARDQDARPVRARSNRLSRRRGFKLIHQTLWAVGGRALGELARCTQGPVTAPVDRGLPTGRDQSKPPVCPASVCVVTLQLELGQV